jgi:acetyl-CoA C-acetyltransferase
LIGIEAFTVEAGAASGGVALRAAYMAVASGQADVALAVGVEKFTDQIGGSVDAAVATSQDGDFESIHGLTPSSAAALLMRRYQYEFNVPHQAFAGFPLTAHANGEGNPNAMYRKAITPEAYQQAGIVSDPLNLYDIAPNADGAAALVLTRAELIPSGLVHPMVNIAGSSVATDTLALHDRRDPLTLQAASQSIEQACRRAGCQPDEINFFEFHDAYSIFAALSLEAAGFAPRGQGWQLAQDGHLSRQGDLPISTMGGSKARGNPGGATGIYQAVEAALQLRGQAGVNQIPNPRRALIQCLGGSAAATAVTHILERAD